MFLASALPATLGDWVSVVGGLFALVLVLGGAIGVLRSKQWAAERVELRNMIETLTEARELDKQEAAAHEQRHVKEIADLRAQVAVLHSEFLAGLAESIVTAVVDTLHPLLDAAQPTRRPAPRKAPR